MQNLVQRFLNYISVDTQSDESSASCPSTCGQVKLAKILHNELITLGLSDVALDDNGYLTAKLPANIDYDVAAIGFIAHMDTAPDASGKNVQAMIVDNYQGGDITLGSSGQVLSPKQFPELNSLHGQTLITTDGKTLLGADNKAGIAEIITAMVTLIQKPEIKHGDICIGFTPDEEIGRGADLFDVKKFGAKWAYTIDGGPLGELEYENFNASSAVVSCLGVNVHPGTAKNKMVNSMTIAAEFISKMPATQTPEATEGYEGFFHLTNMKASVAKTELNYIIRDFDAAEQLSRIEFIKTLASDINNGLQNGSVEVEVTESYRNMREKVEPFPHIIDYAQKAMIACGIKPDIKPIRGGTDGARLSFMGLPCPNIFTGGYNFHGIHEFISVEGMHKAVEVIVKLAEITAESEKPLC
ncbi:peptidase T [Psychromonas antarctica]|uniref:peptidase T n=1 Tax=Psychromonas antarctica TaxID=67573 RepID=UPI001EE82C3F|nr:peptidase T [Psychromonas antarctica]MCG6202289.1 peptidase T [Psychromonas antarctica]